MSDFTAVPMSIKRANKAIAEWHRTHKPVQGGLFAVAIAKGGLLCGVAIIGRPCRELDDGFTAEVTRCATDGTPNACSKLYAIARRVTAILGYRRFTTLTLPEEGGASLRAAGFDDPKDAGGGSWNRRSRPRTDKSPITKKLRWTADLAAEVAA